MVDEDAAHHEREQQAAHVHALQTHRVAARLRAGSRPRTSASTSSGRDTTLSVSMDGCRGAGAAPLSLILLHPGRKQIEYEIINRVLAQTTHHSKFLSCEYEFKYAPIHIQIRT